MERTIRGRVAVAGVGQTAYFRHGQATEPEFVMALQAIMAACEDAGLDVRSVDGFASLSDDRNEPARIASALGLAELRLSTMVWGGGGGGGAAAIANATAAIAAGYADCVVVFRALAQGQFGRYGAGSTDAALSGPNAYNVPYGMSSPAHRMAVRVRRFMDRYGISTRVLRSIAMASYAHAQSNPRALMRGRPLDEERYDAARWIAEPFRLFDCCQENDGAAAVVLVSAERARDLKQKPVYVLGAAQGSSYRFTGRGHNNPEYGAANFTSIAPRVFGMAQLTPQDIDVVQAYENFTGAVLVSLAEHGFFRPEEAEEFLALDNLLAPSGRMPLNTSGGHLAEAYVHGMNLIIEAVRQLRGQSTAQVPGASASLVIAGPMVSPTSSVIFGTQELL